MSGEEYRCTKIEIFFEYLSPVSLHISSYSSITPTLLLFQSFLCCLVQPSSIALLMSDTLSLYFYVSLSFSLTLISNSLNLQTLHNYHYALQITQRFVHHLLNARLSSVTNCTAAQLQLSCSSDAIF